MPEDNSHLPEQIRRQMAEADTIRADMQVPPEGDATAPGEVPSPVSAPASPTQPAVAPTQLPAEEDQTWEQRYKSLHGRFENTQRSNQQMADRLNQMESTLSSLQARGIEPAPPKPTEPAVRPKLITDQETADYGEELLTVVGKRAREEFFPEFEQLAARVQRLQSQVEGAATVIDKTEKQTVYQALTTDVPEWRQVNNSDEFKSWLQFPDQFSGRRRIDMLQEAFARHEAPRVVAFFRGFLTEATGLPPNPSSPGPSAPPLANGNGSGKPSLEDFAAPGRARSAPQEMPPDKPIYTSAWIQKFMADKRTGKYRGREADADAIERDIYQAQHEGRIQNA